MRKTLFGRLNNISSPIQRISEFITYATVISKAQAFKLHMTQRFARILILNPGGLHRAYYHVAPKTTGH